MTGDEKHCANRAKDLKDNKNAPPDMEASGGATDLLPPQQVCEDILSYLRAESKENFIMRETDSIKDLINQAKNTRYLVDEINKSYFGLTTKELIQLALERKEAEHGKEAAANEST